MNFFYIRKKAAEIKNRIRYISYWIEYDLWKLFSNSKKEIPKGIKKVLFVSGGALGDILSTIKVLYNVKLLNKGIRIDLIVLKEYYNAVKKIGDIAKINIIEESKNNNYDLVVLLANPCYLEKVSDNGKYFVGSSYSSLTETIKSIFNSNHYNLLDNKIKPMHKHKVKQEIEIIKLSGLNINEKLKAISIVGKPLKKRYVILHPSGRNFAEIVKNGKIPNLAWPFDRFSKIADYIIDKYGYDVLITGAKDEKEIAENLIEMSSNRKEIRNICGKYKFDELANIYSNAELLISIDTSSLHLAELVGLPTISLFGPTLPEEVAPYGDNEKNIILCHKQEAIPNRYKGPVGEWDKGMKAITSEEVKMAIQRILK